MKKKSLLVIFSVLFSFGVTFAQTETERQEIISHYDLVKLDQLKTEYSEKFNTNYQEALVEAARLGWDLMIEMPNGGVSMLVGLKEDGSPKYYTTHNREGAITTRTNKVHSGGGAGLDLNGEDMVLGVWDGGRVRATHPLLENRVTQIDDPADYSNHSTHVSGTMIGTGAVVNGAAKGMAPQATIRAFDFFGDSGEMVGEAANGMLVSNHSYGMQIEFAELWELGFYSVDAKDVDNLAYNAPYYLSIWSAGNDRQSGVNTGDGGYDYLTDSGTAKNNIVVAATFEVLNYTGPNSVNMSSFSSWGPSDDGRVKPDVSAKGVNMYSSTGTVQYSNFSGTSMSAPNTSGSLILLQQHYNNIYGAYMRSSTLRGLALHTVDEAGNSPGPDYRFGWGLLNIERAAKVITDNGTSSLILEVDIQNKETYTTTVKSDGINDFVSSLTWTDLPGNILPTGVEDDSTPSLINDLDLRVSKDGGATFYPWKLDPSNFNAAATTGDNIVDNIEKIEIAGASGEYIIQVSHKGNLESPNQIFSQIITGIDREEFFVSSNDGIKTTCPEAGSIDFDIDVFFNDGFTDTINFTVSGLPAGTTGNITPSSLSSDGSVTLTVNNINSLTLGDYPIKVTAAGSSESINIYLVLRLSDDMGFVPTELLTPGNNWQNRPVDLTFDWEDGNVLTEEYDFELALDDQFTTIVESETVTESTIDIVGLSYETEYFWRVRTKNSCQEGPFSDTFRFVTKVSLGFNDQTIEKLVIYPNPTSNILNISAATPITNVEVVNILGQVLISEKEVAISQIDVSKLSTGNYFIRVTSENNTNVLQFVKQ